MFIYFVFCAATSSGPGCASFLSLLAQVLPASWLSSQNMVTTDDTVEEKEEKKPPVFKNPEFQASYFSNNS